MLVFGRHATCACLAASEARILPRFLPDGCECFPGSLTDLKQQIKQGSQAKIDQNWEWCLGDALLILNRQKPHSKGSKPWSPSLRTARGT